MIFHCLYEEHFWEILVISQNTGKGKRYDKETAKHRVPIHGYQAYIDLED